MIDFRLRIGADRFRLRDRHEEAEGEAPIPKTELRLALRRLFSEGGVLADERRRRLCRALRLPVISPGAGEDERRAVEARVLHRLETRAALVREPMPEYLREHVVETEYEPIEPREEDVEWIEIVLVDEDEIPVANEPYEIVLSDKRVRRGVTNVNGVIRYERIPSGTCKLTFPRLDKTEYEAG